MFSWRDFVEMTVLSFVMEIMYAIIIYPWCSESRLSATEMVGQFDVVRICWTTNYERISSISIGHAQFKASEQITKPKQKCIGPDVSWEIFSARILVIISNYICYISNIFVKKTHKSCAFTNDPRYPDTIPSLNQFQFLWNKTWNS